MRITKLLKIKIYNYIVEKYNFTKKMSGLYNSIQTVMLITCNLISKKLIDVEMGESKINYIVGFDKYINFNESIKHFTINYPC